MTQNGNSTNRQDNKSFHLNSGDMFLILAILFIIGLAAFAIWVGVSSGKSNLYNGTIHIDSQKNVSFKSDKGEYSNIPKDVIIGVKNSEIKDGEQGCLKTVEKYGKEKYVELYAGETCEEHSSRSRIHPVIVTYH